MGVIISMIANSINRATTPSVKLLHNVAVLSGWGGMFRHGTPILTFPLKGEGTT